MRVLCDRETEKGNKRKNVYDARRSIEEAVNKISGEYYFCILALYRKIINSHRIGDLFHLFRILFRRVACSNGSEMPGCYITCLYYFGSDICLFNTH